MPACRNCGDQFKKSPAGATVNCPSCRKNGGKKPAAEKPQSTACVVCNGDRMVQSQMADGTTSNQSCYGCKGTGRRGMTGMS